MSQVSENKAIAAPVPMTPLQEFWHYFKRNKGAVVGLVYVAVMIIIAVFANFLAPYNPADQFRDLAAGAAVLAGWRQPGASAWYRRRGPRYSVASDVRRPPVAAGGLPGGGPVADPWRGARSGGGLFRRGGGFHHHARRRYYAGAAEPALALVLVAIFGPSIVNASLALTFVALPHYVRLTRAAVLVEVNRDYVTASRVVGAGAMRQMFVNILPNCLAPLIVQASLGFSNAILDMAALGFLGMGAQPPTPEWGTMLSDVLQFAQSAWWVVTFPGVAILLTVLAFNLMGDGLRDALDPKLKQ